MTGVTEATRIIRNDDLPTGEIDGEVVALDLERGECFGLDAIGATIWQIAAQPVSVGEIADQLIETHDVERQQCLDDIVPFIDEMINDGLLRRLAE